MKLKFKRSLDQFFGEEIHAVQAKIAASSELDPELYEERKEEHLAQLYKEIVPMPSSLCDDKTLDFVLNVKQTRTIIAQAKTAINELTLANELHESLTGTTKDMIDDWEEIVKYHRKRTMSKLMHRDLIKHEQLKSGDHTYMMLFDDEETRLINNEGEDLAKSLTVRDTQITIASLEASKVDVDSLAPRYFATSNRVLQQIKEGAIKLRCIVSEVLGIIKSGTLANKKDAYEIACKKLLESYNKS